MAEARPSKLLGMPSFGLLYIYMGKLWVFAELAQNTPIWPVLDLSSPALFAERDFKTRNQKQRTGWGLVQRSRALSEGEAETPMGTAPMDIPHFAIQSAHHLKFKTYLLTVC